ncbi:hypothetical protein PLICRDRAFT_49507 [Plicaturopsis crispa FD-325 SS-3]|nr:hypothetical protein PLICRDRAFT_49507 [Plicaturopsis crispa FD-325 SS-3]
MPATRSSRRRSEGAGALLSELLGVAEPSHADGTLPAARRSTGRKSTTSTAGGWDGSVVINGTKIQTTKVFDTFWWFAAERHRVNIHRQKGLPEDEWTDDTILKKYHFCNPFRVADRVSQYIISDVVEKGSQDPDEIVFRVTLFNMFTKIDTWELLEEELGPLTWASFDRNQYGRVLRRAKDSGISLYTGAFQKPGPKLGNHDTFMDHLELLQMLMEHDLRGICQRAAYIVDVFEFLMSWPSLADFTAYQLLINLSYTPVLNFCESDFVVLGLGAISGLKKCFRVSDGTHGVEIVQWMQRTQHEHFARLGLALPELGPERRVMQLVDFEHTLCEVDKYARVKHRDVHGARSQLKKCYTPSSKPYPRELRLPRAWSHPARQRPRVRPTPVQKVEKRYIISRLVDERQVDGKTEYQVYWLGYPPSDATWEPEWSLLEDAPSALEEYRKSKRKR